MSWLLETLVWTGVLLAAVLLLRRPVARQFGPHAAYALWLLPSLRLLLPPIVLPAWLGPAEQASPVAGAVLAFNTVPLNAGTVPASASADASFDWLVLLPALWLTGAALLLAWRFTAYFRMRGELLVGARQVGEAGRIRLVESPQVASPIALGVIDKLIVLPLHFMAMHDRRSRDLALEHEFAHHRANDLLANMLVQPLFALHWFNPLGYYGWRAMRRDQEAACDARVIAARGGAERAAYAQLIATQVTGPRIALAAPMACPVLGDASIVHRLRNLTMTDISRGQRMAGRALIGAAALALPLTASISYAQAEPKASAVVPALPVAPASPVVPVATVAPAAPVAPASPQAPHLAYASGSDRRVFVSQSDLADSDFVDRQEIERAVREAQQDAAEARREAEQARREAEREAAQDRREAERDAAQARREAEQARREALAEVARIPEIDTDCTTSTQVTRNNQRQVVRVCTKQIMAAALDGIRSSRAEIASDTAMSAKIRKQIIESLDREIRRMTIQIDES